MKAAPIVIQPLSFQRLADLLDLFETRAFDDHPEWRSCYCHFPHADHQAIRWQTRSAVDNRAATCARVEAGTMSGLLAYDGPTAIGWCNAGPRRFIEGLFDEPEPLADRIGAISCFVIAPAYRRRGIATALLEAATNTFRERAFDWIEAYPRAVDGNAAENHHGPRAMYEAAGFTVVRPEGAHSVLMRKDLREPAAAV